MISFRKNVLTNPPPTNMPDLDEFLTTRKAAEKMGLTIRAVNRLVANKKLNAIKIGRMHLISCESVKDYLDKTRDMSKNDPRRKVVK